MPAFIQEKEFADGIDKPLTIKKVLTQDQVAVFLNRAKEYGIQWYPHWCLALYTGMRNGELYALTWDKVNFEQRQILVSRAWNNKDGFKDTKSGDDRIVQVAPKLMEDSARIKAPKLWF